MKILHITAANSSTGAGIACVRLHEQLLKNGIDSKIAFIEEHNDVQKMYLSVHRGFLGLLIRKINTFLDNLLKYFYQYDKRKYFSAGYFGLNINRFISISNCDIIHLHWINHGFVKLSSLRNCKVPIIWTMHDCWTFTGGCHHFYTCTNFYNCCGQCEILKSNNNSDLSNLMQKVKYKSYKNNIIFVAISNWMYNEAKKSRLLVNKEVIKINSGIDTNVFKLYDKYEARLNEYFGVDEKIVIIGAQSLNSLSKGFDFTKQALDRFSKFPLTIITFGNGNLELNNSLHKIYNLGFIDNPIRMAKIFSLGDLFISTPIVESFGMTVAEAQCCGLPVIVFNNSGPEEIIDHMESGYIAQHSLVDDIINGIDFCFNFNFNRIKISRNAINKFSINITCQKYILEYKKIINK